MQCVIQEEGQLKMAVMLPGMTPTSSAYGTTPERKYMPFKFKAI